MKIRGRDVTLIDVVANVLAAVGLVVILVTLFLMSIVTGDAWRWIREHRN